MWSNDPSQNLVIAQNLDASMDGPKICATADGGFYVSWLDHGAGYSLFLQRLDVNGNLLFPTGTPSTDGVLVYERALTYGPRDYALCVDTAGNAILSIDSGLTIEGQVEAGGSAVACKVSPSGELMFGATGITLSQPDELVAEVFCAATSDGGAVFGWSSFDSGSIHMVKLDANGNPLWGDGKIYLPPRTTLALTDIQPADEGGAIYSFAYNVPTPGTAAVSTGFLASKLDSTGVKAWFQDPLILFQKESGSGINAGSMPKFISDGRGGAVYCYVGEGDPRIEFSNQPVCFVQRVEASGVPLYEGNGARVSIDSVDSDNPRLGFDPDTDRIYVIWLSGSTTIRVQCIDRLGQRVWGDLGIELEPPVDNAFPIPVAITPVGGNVMASWIGGSAAPGSLPQPIRVALLDSAGNYVWTSQTVDIKTTATTETDEASAVLGATGYEEFVWADGKQASVLAQNINQDGSLGVV
jgi:hypothetical protein